MRGWSPFVRVTSRSILPPWRSIGFRLALHTYAPRGCIVRVVSQTKSGKIPTRNVHVTARFRDQVLVRFLQDKARVFNLEVFGEDTCTHKPELREEKVVDGLTSRMDLVSSNVSLDSIGPASRAPPTLEDASGRLYKACPARLGFALANEELYPFLQFAALEPSHMAFDFELKWGDAAADADPDVEPPRMTCPASFPLVASAASAGWLGAASAARMRLDHTSRHLRNGSHALVTHILSGGTDAGGAPAGVGTRGTRGGTAAAHGPVATDDAAAVMAVDNWNVTRVTASIANGTLVTPRTAFPPDARTRVVFTATDIMGQTASCVTTAVTFTTVSSWHRRDRWVALRKCQLLHPATPYYPFPRGNIHTMGNIWSFTVG